MRDDCPSDCTYEWQAGTATEAITPDESMWMAGFAKREKPANGVEHDLLATALVIEDMSQGLAAIVSVDVLYIPREIRDAVAQRCNERFGLDPEALMLVATHTHCGPEFREFKLRMYADEEGPYFERAAAYRNRLEDELVSLIGEAFCDRKPASLSYSRARCGFAMNRRLPVEEGVAHVRNPDGPVDHEVPVLVVESTASSGEAEGKTGDDGGASSPWAIVFGYTCHTTTVFSTDYCGDWAGFAKREIEAEYPEASALFVPGFAGDQNPYPRRELELAKQHGQSMANAVRAAVESRRRPIGGPLRTLCTDETLTFSDPPSQSELESACRADERHVRVRAAALRGELEETGTIETEYPYPIQAFGFGDDLSFLALAGEPLVEYGLKLKERVPNLWTIGYANAEFTYLPTARAIYEGGYEGGDVISRSRFPGPLEPAVEDRVLQRSRALIDRVSDGRSVE